MVPWTQDGAPVDSTSSVPMATRSPGRTRDSGCTHVLTLLSEREGAQSIGAAASRAGLAWIWFPLDNADPLDEGRDPEVRELFDRVGRLLEEGSSVVIHCSAGIHRTGMIGYALLRHVGLS